jgi:hypothetical protein
MDRDETLFTRGVLDTPLAYALWADLKEGDVFVAEHRLGPDTEEWPEEVADWISMFGFFYPSHEFDGLITVGVGSVRTLDDTEEGAQSLMCIHAGLSVSDLPGSSKHLVSSLKTSSSSSPDRILAAPILNVTHMRNADKRVLGERIDSGSCPVIETKP